MTAPRVLLLAAVCCMLHGADIAHAQAGGPRVLVRVSQRPDSVDAPSCGGGGPGLGGSEHCRSIRYALTRAGAAAAAGAAVVVMISEGVFYEGSMTAGTAVGGSLVLAGACVCVPAVVAVPVDANHTQALARLVRTVLSLCARPERGACSFRD
jgi:hypothetical protein